MTKIEGVIASNLMYNEPYMRTVFPFLKLEYFQDRAERKVLEEIVKFVTEYNKPPTPEVIHIRLQQDAGLSESEHAKAVEFLDIVSEKTDTNIEWLIDETEKFCKDRAIYNAIVKSIQIIDKKDKELTPDAIPSILQDALGVCFDTEVGHDYIQDSDERFEYYNRKEEKIPFDLEMFNQITDGGVPKKTLNICMAGVGVGKSLFLCHTAASYLSMGKNVLYITMEMADKRIAERIDANLMNVALRDLKSLPKKMFQDRMNKIKNKTEGRLIIKEYPTASAHAGHFRLLLSELSLKQEFVPDVIFIDYLNICCSSRYKMSGSINSYTYIKGIAEELRGLAVEWNVPIVSATQTTRSGYSSSDPGLEDTSESFGLPATADLMFALIVTDELTALNQIMVKQLKNRVHDPVLVGKPEIGSSLQYTIYNSVRNLNT